MENMFIFAMVHCIYVGQKPVPIWQMNLWKSGHHEAGSLNFFGCKLIILVLSFYWFTISLRYSYLIPLFATCLWYIEIKNSVLITLLSYIIIVFSMLERNQQITWVMY